MVSHNPYRNNQAQNPCAGLDKRIPKTSKRMILYAEGAKTGVGLGAGLRTGSSARLEWEIYIIKKDYIYQELFVRYDLEILS